MPFKVLAFAALALTATPAWAANCCFLWWCWPCGGGGSKGAPEPTTLVALGLGAGIIGLAAWRARRRRR